MKRNIISYAWNLFRSVRRNEKDGFSACHELRLVCRYHTYSCYQDWTIRWRFQKPVSRADFIDACNLCIQEMEWTYRQGIFDHINHYIKTHHLLLVLRLLAERLPLLWHLAFQWPLL